MKFTLKSIECSETGIFSLDNLFLKTKKDNVFFIFNPKCACSYLKRCILQSIYGKISFSDPSYYMDNWDEHNLVHALSHEVLRVDGRLALTTPNRKIVTFCRNPYARLVSAYRDKISNPPIAEQEHWKWMRREMMFDAFRRRSSENLFSEFSNHVPFDYFVNFVINSDHSMKDFHWGNQTDLIHPNKIDNLIVIKVENIADELPNAWYHLFDEPIPIGASIKFNDAKTVAPVHFSKRIAEKIHTYYQDDFLNFGYSSDSWKELDRVSF